MGNTSWGLGIHLVFVCIILVMMAHKSVYGGNLTTPSCYEQERLALVKFKHSIRDDHGLLSSWGVGNNCCRWEGVGCDDVTGRVVSLHLRRKVRESHSLRVRDNKLLVQDNSFSRRYTTSCGVVKRIRYVNKDHYLVGDELNSCLTELVNLKHLDLSGNDFQESQIPEFIGSLKQLRYLNLSGARFSGNIPYQFGNLSNLKILDLSQAGFSGNIPHQIGNLSNLKILDMADYSHELMIDDMAWISALSKLEHLDVTGVDISKAQNYDNLLYTIPSLLKLSLSGCGLSIANVGSLHLNSSRELANIKYLDLSGNDFRGKLPGLFLNMTSLAFLDLSCNYCSPHLNMAWSFENLLNMIPYVSELHLSSCKIEKINLSPTDLNFSTHSNIQHLKLTGPLTNLPHEYGGLLLLQNNFFKGSIPRSLCTMVDLYVLDLSKNGLTGKIPKCLWNMSLYVMLLSSNRLSGAIPSPLGPNLSLRWLLLNNNNFNGELPGAFRYFRLLTVFDIGENKISGNIPKWIGKKFTSLIALRLHKNNFTGRIPHSLCKCSDLQILDLAHNNLTGSIPHCFGELNGMKKKSFYTFDSRFSGYGNMTQVIKGVALEYTKTLQFVINMDLSSNKLVGEIPEVLTLLDALVGLNLS